MNRNGCPITPTSSFSDADSSFGALVASGHVELALQKNVPDERVAAGVQCCGGARGDFPDPL